MAVPTLMICMGMSRKESCDMRELCRKLCVWQYKQKVQAWTRERAALAKVIAYLPFLTILALKLIVPFVIQGVSQLGMYSDNLTTMM